MKALRIIIGIILAVVGTQIFCFWLAAEFNAWWLAVTIVLWSASMWCFAKEDTQCNPEKE